MSSKLRRLALPVAVALLLVGCATIEGVGYDISAGARAVGGWFGR